MTAVWVAHSSWSLTQNTTLSPSRGGFDRTQLTVASSSTAPAVGLDGGDANLEFVINNLAAEYDSLSAKYSRLLGKAKVGTSGHRRCGDLATLSASAD